MPRTFTLVLVALVSLAVAASALGAASRSASSAASLKVNPTTVKPNGAIRFTGSTGSCGKGSKVTVLSNALPTISFAQGGLKGRVRANHTFSIKGYVRGNATAGSYPVSVKCGKSDLGVSGAVQVQG